MRERHRNSDDWSYQQIPQAFTRAARQMADLYGDAWRQMMESNLRMAREWTSLWQQPEHGRSHGGWPAGWNDCCPPEPSCPPRCLAEIERKAYPGEVIVASFRIKNKCGARRTYQLGVRPLMDRNGEEAPTQPTLNRDSVDLEPGQAVSVQLRLDLSEGFQTGQCYTADIVIREREVNQNICFKVCVVACHDEVTVCPLDEREYFLRWQPWQSHYYCDTRQSANRVRIDTNEG